jgi:hypothetical protein
MDASQTTTLPHRSLEQQLPRYTAAQESRRAEIMRRIAAETAIYRARIGADERELAEIERAALT